MTNTLHLLIRPARMSGPRHGGARLERHATLFVNGLTFEFYDEGSPGVGHATGAYYDRHIAARIKHFENALGCQCIRARLKEKRP